MNNSLGRRLFWQLAYSITALWLIAVAAIAFFSYRETNEIFDNSLQETAQRLLALSVHQLQLGARSDALAGAQPIPHSEYVTYQVYDRHGAMLMRSHDAPEAAYPVDHQPGFYRVRHQVYCVEMTVDGRYLIVLAEGPFHREHTVAALVVSLLVPLGALLFLTYFTLYWAIRKAGQPIDDFAAAVGSRHGSHLAPLSVSDHPAEFAKIADSVNSLLQRVERALNSEKDFSSHCGHELRTPIAIALAQIDRASQLASQPEAARTLAEARAAVTRIKQTTEKLLQLARAESGMALSERVIDLTRIVQLVVQDMSYACRHPIVAEVPEHAVLARGDMDAFGIVLINLIENADKYAEPDSPILVALGSDATLRVENDCAPVAADLLPRLTERFCGGEGGQFGAGLGLAIVAALVGQMNAELTLSSPCNAEGRGFRVLIRFRAEPAEHSDR